MFPSPSNSYRSVTRGGPKDDLTNDAGYGAFTFNELDDAVDAREGDFFAEATGPDDFKLVDFRSGAEAEVEARVGRGSVAGAAEDVRALADAACGEEDFCADGIAGGMMRWRIWRRKAPATVGGRYRRGMLRTS